MMDPLAQTYLDRHPDDCAAIPARWWQVAWYGLWLAAFLFWTLYRWDVALAALNFLFTFWYLGIIVFRSSVAARSAWRPCEIRLSAQELAALPDRDLPIYTLLIPLYHEANIANKIIPRLEALDYPKDKLDVKLLLEADDRETVRAIRDLRLPPRYETLVLADTRPKTKPKACNYGLACARGEFCVIFDAEDRPEPDQLKKVVLAFRRLPEQVACIQAKLNFYNARDNLLSRWFSIEYATTFDIMLPGLQHARIPMPLGGTSNHFRTAILRQLDGWDPFNVTEDCDLGVRIYRGGYSTRMIDSTTWEEACANTRGWLRQRSRWVKGFFQTHLVHSRNPLRALRQLGVRGYLGFVLTVGGSSLMMALNVLYWIMGGAYLTLAALALAQGHTLYEIVKGPRAALAGSPVWPMLFYGPQEDWIWKSLSIFFFVVALALFLANFLFVGMHVLACSRRHMRWLLPFALLMPLYWVLISIGAWKGLLQLFTNPHYWEKTEHGRSAEDAPAAPRIAPESDSDGFT
jgi:glycosyltransferase XagB